jgi:ABC-type branched-subunit amino acid transport system ATPase component/branched-subunit amino acid ABC-type transport system permease component
VSTFWQFVLLGIGLCPAYVLAAQGTVLVYRGSGVVNFAQGAFGLIGAYAGFELQSAGFAPLPALLGGVLAGAAAGALTYVLVMRRLERASQLVRIVATLGLSVFVTQALALHYANNASFPNPIISKTTVHIFGAHISRYDLALFIITVVLTAALWALSRYTKFGLRTSAVSENPRAAAALGHSPDLIGLINWTLGGALGALAAILISADLSLSLTTTGYLLVPALAAALMGRFTSFWLTLVGGLIVAIGSSLLTYYNPGQGWSDAFPFLVVVAILLFRSSSLPARGEFASRLPALGSGRIRWPIAITAIVGTGIVIAALSANGQLAMTASLTTAIVCLSLTVVTGYAGQISLAQLGLAGAGAFFAAKFSASSGLTFWESLIVGVVVAAVFGLIVGLPALRTRGVSLAIVTLGLGLTVQDVILNNANLAGSGGELQTHQPTLFSYAFDSTDHPGRYAVFCLILFALCAIMVANVRRSRVGRQLIALRANERAAVALGINTTLAKLYAFVIAAGIAGLGGVLIAFEPSVIVFIPDSGGPMFDPVTAITLFSLLVVGGIGFIGGGLFAGMIAGGGLGAWLLSDIFHSTTANNWLPVLGGAAAVATVMFAPDGISARQAKDFARLFRPLFAYLDRHERAPRPVPSPVAELTTGDSVLEIKDLGVRFGGVLALDGVSVQVRSGEVVGLIGPNGAGKTTLMDAVSGLNRNYTGQISLNGASVDGDNPTRRARLGIGRSFQQPELFDDLLVEDNLRVACEPPSRWDYFTGLLSPRRRELPAAAAIAVREFELADDLARMPGELPFGKRRLVGIARAVAAAPKILLLDEPAAGLDDHESEELATLITRLARERGYGILLIEHNVNLVMSVSDHVVALEFGRVIARGLPDEVRNDPALVAAYLGNATTVEEHEPAPQA